MNDRQLAAAVCDRDERAIDRLINKYSRLLWSVVCAALAGFADSGEAEECVADVFIYFWQHPEKFDSRRGDLKTWLCVLARSRAIDRYRSLSRRQTEVLGGALPSPEPALEDRLIYAEDKERLAAALEMLSETDREILLRRYYHRQKPAEIALALDMKVKTVDNRLYLAKKQLKELLDD